MTRYAGLSAQETRHVRLPTSGAQKHNFRRCEISRSGRFRAPKADRCRAAVRLPASEIWVACRVLASASGLSALGELGDCHAAMHLPATATNFRARKAGRCCAPACLSTSASELSALGEPGDCCAAMHLPATAGELPRSESLSRHAVAYMPNSASELSALGELGDRCAATHLPDTADELPHTEGRSLPRGGVLVDLDE